MHQYQQNGKIHQHQQINKIHPYQQTISDYIFCFYFLFHFNFIFVNTFYNFYQAVQDRIVCLVSIRAVLDFNLKNIVRAVLDFN
jgi:hypothetical protein